MAETAIVVDNLGKRFQIGALAPGFRTFREAITDTARLPAKKILDLFKGSSYGAAHLEEQMWAFREVSFDVTQGEVLGIVGRNGAGKSTLLKILARITEPTEGRARIRGRVGALLEVGTGLHHELTGRENIYLYGSILGMKRSEVNNKFDEIVEFSGIGKFLETPMKHYSDGMRVRLAFSVAAHLEPDILLVDEVLAVGDAEFQKKCLGKMEDVVGEGRTVLFVSHNMVAVRELCPRCILLDRGRLIFDGATDEAITHYMSEETLSGNSEVVKHAGIWIVREYFRGVEQTGEGLSLLPGQPFTCGLEIQTDITPDRSWVNLDIYSMDGVRLVHIRNDYDSVSVDFKPGMTSIEINIDDLPLLPDSYIIRFRLVSEYGGHIVTDEGREFPLLVKGSKAGQGREQAFVRARHSWVLND